LRIGTVRLLDEGGTETAAALVGGAPVLVRDAAPDLPEGLAALLASGRAGTLRTRLDRARPYAGRVAPAPPLRRPGKILGIGLNFRDHARDLGETAPRESPASFFKPASTIIGAGETIVLPPESARVTAEAELAVVFGPRGEPFGYLPVLDMTAEDILRRNPRYLTRAKSFATFLALGEWIVTPDEMPSPLESIRVTTLRNGAPEKSATLAAMTFSPRELVTFHARVFPWEPGDLLLTGTPGAVAIEPGDVAGARVEGVGEFACPVARGFAPGTISGEAP
jgi:2-keto-4-pentenoate hydratase/2-oxohepta-3-ene-1,7-dioic acid hydratase in catechol pathway